MPLMTWTPNFSVGIQSIDDQHKKLMEMLNDLFENMQSGKGKEALGSIMNQLIEYTVKHFKYEEGIFAKVGYPEQAAHKAEHDSLQKRVLEIQERYNTSQTGAISLEVVNFLKSWLTNHIQGTDMKYGPYLTSKGIT